MTKDEFLAALTGCHAERPFILRHGSIRQQGSDNCPICVVCNNIYSTHYTSYHYRAAARKLSLTNILCDAIVSAADDSLFQKSKRLRQLLLTTLTLTEDVS